MAGRDIGNGEGCRSVTGLIIHQQPVKSHDPCIGADFGGLDIRLVVLGGGIPGGTRNNGCPHFSTPLRSNRAHASGRFARLATLLLQS